MQILRNEKQLKLSVTPIYQKDKTTFKVCFLNSRSLHRHIEDIRKDSNFSSIDVNIFTETMLRHVDKDCGYAINKYNFFRNDNQSVTPNIRPYGGTAVYSRIPFVAGYQLCQNTFGVELTVIKLTTIPLVTIVGVYRSPKVSIGLLRRALMQVLSLHSSTFNIFIGDFNVNWLNEKENIPLQNLFIEENSYRQLVSLFTTDNRTTIDHIYTNLPPSQVSSFEILETYFSDHKGICLVANFPQS